MWITNGPDADVLVVYAKTDPDAGPRGITAFLVEKGIAGFAPAQKLDKLGMRGSNTGGTGVRGLRGAGGERARRRWTAACGVLMSGLDYERAVLAGGPLGIMQACLDVVLPYRARAQAVRPADRRVPADAGQARRHVHHAERRARLRLRGGAAPATAARATRKDAAGAILYAAERATWMALEAIQCLGGNGYINDYPTGRLLRDAKLYEIGAGTSEIRRMLIGRELFARDRMSDPAGPRSIRARAEFRRQRRGDGARWWPICAPQVARVAEGGGAAARRAPRSARQAAAARADRRR